jgi:hypothetical protein
VNYVYKDEHGTYESTLTTEEQPDPKFLKRLQSFTDLAIEVCELGDVKKEVTIISVSYKYDSKGNEIGGTIALSKTLVNSAAPITINTPFLSFTKKKKLGNQDVSEHKKSFTDLLVHAQAFIDGKRQQIKIDE